MPVELRPPPAPGAGAAVKCTGSGPNPAAAMRIRWSVGCGRVGFPWGRGTHGPDGRDHGAEARAHHRARGSARYELEAPVGSSAACTRERLEPPPTDPQRIRPGPFPPLPAALG